MPPVLPASSAFWLIALKPRPGGSISPFCEQATDTSTPQASCLYSTEPSEEIVSTISSAGWPVRSSASRTGGMRLVTPVDVSLCTTITALMAWDGVGGAASARSPRRRPRGASRPG